jgi:hypothetical protein
MAYMQMSWNWSVHKLTIALGVLGILLVNLMPVIPPGFWTQFAVGIYAAISPIVALIKTAQDVPLKADVPKLPPIGDAP